MAEALLQLRRLDEAAALLLRPPALDTDELFAKVKTKKKKKNNLKEEKENSSLFLFFLFGGLFE